MTGKTVTQSYVYEGKEVVLTGREAKKKTRSGKTKTVVEIKPKDLSGDFCNKWVDMIDLFEIVDSRLENE